MAEQKTKRTKTYDSATVTDVKVVVADMKAAGFLEIDLDNIIDYCRLTKNTKWLKEEGKKKTTKKVYPRKQEKRINDDGEEYIASVADKSKEPIEKVSGITLAELKTNFLEKFLPELMPKSSKEPTVSMLDKIAALPDDE